MHATCAPVRHPAQIAEAACGLAWQVHASHEATCPTFTTIFIQPWWVHAHAGIHAHAAPAANVSCWQTLMHAWLGHIAMMTVEVMVMMMTMVHAHALSHLCQLLLVGALTLRLVCCYLTLCLRLGLLDALCLGLRVAFCSSRDNIGMISLCMPAGMQGCMHPQLRGRWVCGGQSKGSLGLFVYLFQHMEQSADKLNARACPMSRCPA